MRRQVSETPMGKMAILPVVGLLLSLMLFLFPPSTSFWSLLLTFFKAIVWMYVLLLVLLLLDFCRRIPSDGPLSWPVYARLYVVKVYTLIGAMFVSRQLEYQTHHCRESQERFLLRHLKKLQNTEYGRIHKFSTIQTREDFVKRQCLTDYEHYRGFVQRMVDGENNVLINDKIKLFVESSGTGGGQKKLFPMPNEAFELVTKKVNQMIFTAVARHYPIVNELRQMARLTFNFSLEYTPGGTPIGALSSVMKNKFMDDIDCCPGEAVEGMSNANTVFYIKLLFALKQKGLGIIFSTYTSAMYFAFRILENKHYQLVDDIERGRIDPYLDITDDIRLKINMKLKADPTRAKELREEFAKGFAGIVTRLWPHLDSIQAIVTGSMSVYRDLLANKYCKGLPFYSHTYGCSEGCYAVNLWPRMNPVSYLPLPNDQFLEFIPVDFVNDRPENHIMFADQVKVGELYELVATTLHGLYRYRTGDVFKVAGLHNEFPLLEYSHRLGEVIEIQGMGIPGSDIYRALVATVKEWPGVILHDYTITTSVLKGLAMGDVPGSTTLVVFIELEGDVANLNITDELKATFDVKLGEQLSQYAYYLSKEILGYSSMHFVRPGTFWDFQQYIVHHSKTSVSQLKVPRSLKRHEHIKFIDKRVAY